MDTSIAEPNLQTAIMLFIGLGVIIGGAIRFMDSRTSKAVESIKAALSAELQELKDRLHLLEEGQRLSKSYIRKALIKAVSQEDAELQEWLEQAEANLLV